MTEAPAETTVVQWRDKSDGSKVLPPWLLESGDVILDAFNPRNISQEILERLWEESAHYPSRPLEADSGEFRVIHLLPGQWSDGLACELEVVRLDDSPVYEALSYTWGSSYPARSIRVGDRQNFPVSDTAFTALRRLRYADKTRMLWVDSICISQGSLDERKQQVSIMGSIYRNCQRCLVWFGEMRNPDGETKILGTDKTVRPRDGSKDFRPLEILDEVWWSAAAHWWERTWVIQECALAPEVVVCFGPYQVAWANFCWDFLRVEVTGEIEGLPRTSQEKYLMQGESDKLYPIRSTMRNRMESLSTMRFYSRPGHGHSIFSMALSSLHDVWCSDRRDKVFAMLSLIDPNEAQMISVDYARPWVEVYAKATFASIQVQGDLEILSLVALPEYATQYREGRPRPELPTWAVNFDRPLQFKEDSTRLPAIGPRYWSGWKVGAPRIAIAKIWTHTALMTLRGYFFDRILHRDEYASRTLTTEEASALTLQLLACAVRHAQSAKIYENVHGPPKPSVVLDCLTQDVSVLTSSKKFREPLRLGDAVEAALTLWSNATAAQHASEYLLSNAHILKFDIYRMWLYLQTVSGPCTTCITEKGFICLAPASVRTGDSVVLFRGSKFPAFLRPDEDLPRVPLRYARPDGDVFTFGGFGYVHGVMYDELKRLGLDEGLSERSFVLS